MITSSFRNNIEKMSRKTEWTKTLRISIIYRIINQLNGFGIGVFFQAPVKFWQWKNHFFCRESHFVFWLRASGEVSAKEAMTSPKYRCNCAEFYYQNYQSNCSIYSCSLWFVYCATSKCSRVWKKFIHCTQKHRHHCAPNHIIVFQLFDFHIRLIKRT